MGRDRDGRDLLLSDEREGMFQRSFMGCSYERREEINNLVDMVA